MNHVKYCKFCHRFWKSIKEYDRHSSYCEYDYNWRRNPQPEMDENGIRIPSMREMFRYVKDLSYRLEKTEKEVVRLRNLLNTKQKRAILEWLNQPRQTPPTTFEAWWHDIKAQESDVLIVVNRDLTEGIMSCLIPHIKGLSRIQSPPIRCFTQKLNTFYVYSFTNAEPNAEEDKDAAAEPKWRIMNNEQMEKMIMHISKSLLREFIIWWENSQSVFRASEGDERAMDKKFQMMQKMNGFGISQEKRLIEIKTRLFSEREENLRVVMDCEFE